MCTCTSYPAAFVRTVRPGGQEWPFSARKTWSLSRISASHSRWPLPDRYAWPDSSAHARSCVVTMAGTRACWAMTPRAQARPPSEVRQSSASTSHVRPPAESRCALVVGPRIHVVVAGEHAVRHPPVERAERLPGQGDLLGRAVLGDVAEVRH